MSRFFKRKNKHNNKPVWIDGYYFQSTLEGEGYKELKLYVAGGLIENLELQEDIPLHINEIHLGDYRCDYKFKHKKSGSIVIGEAKGRWEALAKWKWKHVQAEYPEYEYALYMGKKWSGFNFSR